VRIVIESTDEVMELDGVPVRAWNGVTQAGIHCRVFIHRIAVPEGVDAGEFDRRLARRAAPREVFIAPPASER